MSIVVIALFSWYYPARLVRSSVLSLRETPFVEAAHMMGASHSRLAIVSTSAEQCPI